MVAVRSPHLLAMADSGNSKEMQVDKSEEKKPEETQQPQLGVLEEDDEFEEFAVQGQPPRSTRVLRVTVPCPRASRADFC
jgi:hypothetical protein